MDELSRIEVANQLLSKLFMLCTERDKDKKINIIYSFLLGDDKASKYDSEFCTSHGIEQSLLNTYKKDSWLLILLDSYEYLIAKSEHEELTEFQQSFLTKIDSLEFNFTNLYAFFTSSDNKQEILSGIESYYEYWLKGNEFIKQCRDYNYNNQTLFRNRLTAYIGNIEAMDFMATVFDDLDVEYQKKINETIIGEEEYFDETMDTDEYEDIEEYDESFEEDFDEDEYQVAVDEMFDESAEEVEKLMKSFKIELHAKIMDLLDEYLEDKFECDEFIGFFMSYVYMIILNNKTSGKLFTEEEQLLKVLTHEDLSIGLIVETFYSNPDYVFAALDTFCRYYYKNNCDVLTIRDRVTSSIERNRINMMDEYYSNGKRLESIKMVNNPFFEVYDMLYMKFKIDYPDDYVSRLYMSLTGENFDSIFYEFDLNEDINYHRIMMIRYFSRKFIESVVAQAMDSQLDEEYEVFAALLKVDTKIESVVRIFLNYGIVILNGYNNLLDKTISEEKEIVKHIYDYGKGNNLFRIDPGMISDSLYYRSLNDTPLFKYVEKYGIDRTIKYLVDLSNSDYEQYADYMKEVLASLYCNFKNVSALDSVDNIVKMAIDSTNFALDDYFRSVIRDESLMYQLLTKYYEIEKEEDYPRPIEERIVQHPKVKEKLYPVTEKDSPNS